MQSVICAQFLNITPLFLFSFNRFALSSAPSVIVPLARTYPSLESHKLHFSSEVLNLI